MHKKSLLDSVEVKTPCAEEWNEMKGGDEVRFCSHCAKSVYNLSAMTRVEARKLIAQSNGNLCVRYVKRPDGQVQTVDRPLYRIGRRTTRIAAGAFGAAISLSASAYAQGEPILPKQEKSSVRKSAAANKIDTATASLVGTILDSLGAVIPGAKITLTDTKSGKIYTNKSNDEGVYGFANLNASVYRIEAEANSFAKFVITEIDIKDAQKLEKNLNLTVDQVTTLLGDITIITEYKVELTQAASMGDKVRLRKLIADGKNINEKDASSHGQSPLHIAAETGDTEIAQIFLDAKADVNITDDDGETPLMIAARNNHPQTVQLLLKAGANPHLKDNAGKTALQITNSEEIKQLLKQYDAN